MKKQFLTTFAAGVLVYGLGLPAVVVQVSK